MSREVKVGDAVFIVNSYSRKGATETLDQMLKRVIVQNAERESRNVSEFCENEDTSYRKIS